MIKKYFKQSFYGYLFLLPAVAFVLIFILGPMIQAFFYSFMKWNLLGTKKPVGLKNYEFIFTKDFSFIKSILNTFIYSFITVILTICLSLFSATLFQQQTRVNNVLRSFVFIPVIVPMAVMGLVWRMLYEPKFGVINKILEVFHFSGLNWLYDGKLAMISIIIFSIWKEFGLYTIIFIGGLQQIPRELYESAMIDGAGRKQTFFRITIPSLKPIFFFVATMLLITTMKAFDHIWVMTEGGPGYSTSVLVTFIYTRVFDNVGIASAASIVLFMLIFTITLFRFLLQRRNN